MFEDCACLASVLREIDIQEIEAVSDLPAVNDLELSFAYSIECWVVLNGDAPCAMFGVSKVEAAELGQGMIWMVAGKEAEDESLAFAVGKISRDWYRKLKPKYTRLYNFVDVKNTRTIGWLRWLGFRMVKLHINYAAGKTFWEFDNVEN